VLYRFLVIMFAFRLAPSSFSALLFLPQADAEMHHTCALHILSHLCAASITHTTACDSSFFPERAGMQRHVLFALCPHHFSRPRDHHVSNPTNVNQIRPHYPASGRLLLKAPTKDT
jgi:hypothetical protein